MEDPAAALRPLDEAAAAVDRLRHYESTTDLSAAIETVHAAVDRALRIRLRTDPSASDSDRMAALSARDLSLDDVVRSLRTRDLISLEAAGTVHELKAAAARAHAGDARPADADVTLRAVAHLRAELGTGGGVSVLAGSAAPTGDGADEHVGGEEDVPPERRGRWMAWLGAAFAALIVAVSAWALMRGGAETADAAITAFRAGRLDSAAVAFERVLEDRPSDVGARLYLGRIHRREGRLGEAATVLRDAARLAPSDPDVRRELGHLFMDLDQPRAAIEQYERALETDPDQLPTWAGLIRALRAAGDPRAERLLADAPAEVQALFGREGGADR